MVKVPPQLTIDSLTREFLKLVSERYPTADKALQAAIKLGANSIEEKIIILSQFRDAIRQVAVNQVYRSIQHRDELYKSIIDALEELEDQLDEAIAREEAGEEIQVEKKDILKK